eukprot:GHVU01118233.1.p1 GENE.GHVU01118233.1~~GHVU01118233.1.p1  ORF type:complete len:100 (-),score=4.09 GHVU01118233.1:592-891(-)
MMIIITIIIIIIIIIIIVDIFIIIIRLFYIPMCNKTLLIGNSIQADTCYIILGFIYIFLFLIHYWKKSKKPYIIIFVMLQMMDLSTTFINFYFVKAGFS